MTRITVEDCNKYVSNRFDLVLIAAQRGKELNRGATPQISSNKDKEAIVALREIALGLLDIPSLEKSIVKKVFIENQERQSGFLIKKKFENNDDSAFLTGANVEESETQADCPRDRIFKNEENICE